MLLYLTIVITLFSGIFLYVYKGVFELMLLSIKNYNIQQSKKNKSIVLQKNFLLQIFWGLLPIEKISPLVCKQSKWFAIVDKMINSQIYYLKDDLDPQGRGHEFISHFCSMQKAQSLPNTIYIPIPEVVKGWTGKLYDGVLYNTSNGIIQKLEYKSKFSLTHGFSYAKLEKFQLVYPNIDQLHLIHPYTNTFQLTHDLILANNDRFNGNFEMIALDYSSIFSEIVTLSDIEVFDYVIHTQRSLNVDIIEIYQTLLSEGLLLPIA